MGFIIHYLLKFYTLLVVSQVTAPEDVHALMLLHGGGWVLEMQSDYSKLLGWLNKFTKFLHIETGRSENRIKEGRSRGAKERRQHMGGRRKKRI